eukprot:1773225-Alexandrium_andersonii.AAC.1
MAPRQRTPFPSASIADSRFQSCDTVRQRALLAHAGVHCVRTLIKLCQCLICTNKRALALQALGTTFQ